MNKERVRQINKALKDEIRFLYMNTQRVNLITEPKRVKKYKVKQTVEESYLHQLSDNVECPMSYIKDSISGELAKKIVENMFFRIEPSTIPYHVDIVGIVSVLSDNKVE